MELPDDGLPEARLEHRRKIAIEVLEELKLALQEQSRASKIWLQVLMLSLAIIGVILTLYNGPFSDDESDLWSILWGPGELQQIQLSDLMATDRPQREAVYVLVLDVSGSLLEDKVTESSVTLFADRLSADGVKIPDECRPGAPSTRWHLARAQLCCYLHHLEEGARVGLWKFGRSASLLSEAKSHRLERLDETLEVQARRDLLERLMSPQVVPRPGAPEYSETNFEKLLDELYKGYIKDSVYKGKDLHFVIVSDFVHDSGVRDHPSFVLSMEKIARTFRNIGEVDDAVFHLVATGASNSEVSSVIRVVQNSVVWYQYRFDSFERSSSDPMPDFLFNFVPSKDHLTFYKVASPSGFTGRSNTSRVDPIHLVWNQDLPQEEGARLMVGFMTDTYRNSGEDLAIHVAEGRSTRPCLPPRDINSEVSASVSSGLKRAVLKPGGRHEFPIRNPGDYLCVKPLMVDSEEAYEYKLTLSRSGQGGDSRIYVVDIRFQRFLPPLVSVVLVTCLGAFLISSAYLSLVAAKRLRQRWSRS